MIRYDFAIIAQETTSFWNLPEESKVRDCRIFTLSLFRIGEATHVCSLTPSTYVQDMQNVFMNRDGSPLTDEQIAELDREGLEFEGLDHSYIGYVNPDRVGTDPRIGDTYWNEYDPDDFEDREEMDRAAWDDAREEMSANSGAYEPALDDIPEPA